MTKLFFLAGIMLLGGCSSTTKTYDESKTESNNNLTEETIKEKNMGTIRMTKADFLTKIHDFEKDTETWKYLGDKPAIIDFYASWCGPCKQIAPILEELAKEYHDQIYIYKVNVEEEQELAALFGIRSVPTMLFIPLDGQPQMAAGAASKADLKRAIDEILIGK